MIGEHRLIIRGCDFNHGLIELNLYVEVIENYPPRFVNDSEVAAIKNIVLGFGKTETIKIPKFEDPDKVA